jgi:hypothetical protein
MKESPSSQPNNLLETYLEEARGLAKSINLKQVSAKIDAQIANFIDRLTEVVITTDMWKLDVYHIAEICILTAKLTGREQNDGESFLDYLRTLSAFYAVPAVRGHVRDTVRGSMPQQAIEM